MKKKNPSGVLGIGAAVKYVCLLVTSGFFVSLILKDNASMKSVWTAA